MPLESLLLDFEHERITVRFEDGSEQCLRARDIAPRLFDAMHDAAEVSDEELQSAIAAKVEKAAGNNDAIKQFRSEEYSKQLRKNLKFVSARHAAEMAAHSVMTGWLAHFEDAFEAKRSEIIVE